MEREEIEITIQPDGHVEYRIRGVKGPKCEEISAVLEALGRVESSERTDEFFDGEAETHIHVGDE